MNTQTVPFKKVAIEPVKCLTEAKALLGEQYWSFVLLSFVALFISGLVPFYILLGPMFCGLYRCYFDRIKGRTPELGDLFKGFDYFKESLIASLVIMGISMVVMMPIIAIYIGIAVAIGMGVAEAAGEDGVIVVFIVGYFGYFVLLFAVQSILGALFVFVFQLIVDHGLTGTAAISTSFKAAKANLGGLIGLMLLNMLLGFAGAMCCIVGLFLVMPITVGASIVAYRKVFPDGAYLSETGGPPQDPTGANPMGTIPQSSDNPYQAPPPPTYP